MARSQACINPPVMDTHGHECRTPTPSTLRLVVSNVGGGIAHSNTSPHWLLDSPLSPAPVGGGGCPPSGPPEAFSPSLASFTMTTSSGSNPWAPPSASDSLWLPIPPPPAAAAVCLRSGDDKALSDDSSSLDASRTSSSSTPRGSGRFRAGG